MKWEEGGEFNLFTPVTKDALKTSLYKIGEAEIETPLGKFKTDKVCYNTSDPLLAKLLKQYVDAFVFYIEKSPKRRLIKFENGIDGSVYLLDKASIVN